MRRAIGLLALLGSTGCAQAPSPRAEHHLHLQTAASARIVAKGLPPGLVDSSGADAAKALRALDSAGVREALAISGAYLFGSDDAEGSAEERERLTRAENEFVAEQSARAPGRLHALCSANPLTDFGIRELQRCIADPRFAAVKLHFTSSQVDLRDTAHLATLRSLFADLARARLPALVHLRTTREDYGRADVLAFVREVLVPNPDALVQIAHVGGWGGYDDATDAALAAFAEAFADGSLDRRRVSFDLAAVVFDARAAGADSALAQRVVAANARLAARMREIGLDRFVFATDWPGWPPVPGADIRIRRQAELIRQSLPLTSAELAVVFANESVALSAARGRSRTGNPPPRSP